jgi:hypothetical protein
LLAAGLTGAAGIALTTSTGANGVITVTATNNTGANLASGAALLSFAIASTQDAVVEATENFTVDAGQRDGDGGQPNDHDEHYGQRHGDLVDQRLLFGHRGNVASYTVKLAGTLQASQTATINLAIANISTTSADYANFATAVQTAITGRADLSFNAVTGTLTYTGTGQPDDRPGNQFGCG